MDKQNIKHLAKWIGNICVLIAVIFIVRKLYSYDIDYSILLNVKSLIIFLLCCIFYSICIVVNSLPWKNCVELLTDKKIDCKMALKVATKSNLMKYLPGNVFQYIGKNELAVVCNLNHAKVASATFLDICITIVSALIMALIFCYDGMRECFRYLTFLSEAYIYIAFGIIFILVLMYLFRKKIGKLFCVYKCILEKRGIRIILFNALLYMCSLGAMSVIYVLVLGGIVKVEVIGMVLLVSGAFIFSWIAGFIVPGAPGGIGIRETILTLVLGNIINENSVLLAIVIYRLISTIGDLGGYLICSLVSCKGKKMME